MEQNKTLAKQLKINNFSFEINDINGNEIYFENSRGFWHKKEFNQNNERIYYENSNGIINDKKPKTLATQLKINNFPFMIKDNNENTIYYEDFKGYWYRVEFDENQPIYLENSYGISKFPQNRSCTKTYQYTKPSFLRRLFNGIKNFLEI